MYQLLVEYIQSVKEATEIEAAFATGDDAVSLPGLPEELLSIIVDMDLSLYSEEHEFEESRYCALQGYLMAWNLVFLYFRDTVRDCLD